MKKLIAASAALVMLVSLTSASASEPGSTEDPLVTLSYLTDTYTDEVLELGEELISQRLQQTYDDKSREVQSRRPLTGGYAYMTAKAGSSFGLSFGCSVILTSGSVSVEFESGSVIEISSGDEIQSGYTLESGKRYFCLEDTEAVFTANSNSVVMIDGGCYAGDGVEPVLTAYTDVSPLNWFYYAAVYAHDNLLFRDSDTDLFRPEDDVTRADTVYALWRAVGCPEPEASAGFDDLDEEWYRQAVDWAVGEGIINGIDNNMFDPDGSLTRQQMALILYRYTMSIGEATDERADLSAYLDNGNVAQWAYEAVSWANAKGILNGFSDTELSPETATARCQLATILMRYAG